MGQQLTRVEIHGGGRFIRGGVGGVLYDSLSWDRVCKEKGLDPDEAEEKALSYHLPYPPLPPGDYTFWFTEEGFKEFIEHHGLLLAQAGALWEGGEVVILHRPYVEENIIYQDRYQVAYDAL